MAGCTETEENVPGFGGEVVFPDWVGIVLVYLRRRIVDGGGGGSRG
jgi:hypothetical protein